MLKILRRISLFGSVDPARLYSLLCHKRFNAVAPDVPAMRIRLHPSSLKAWMRIFFWYLKVCNNQRRRSDTVGCCDMALSSNSPRSRVSSYPIMMCNSSTATGALDQVDVSGMQWIKFTEHHANVFLSAGKLQPEKRCSASSFARWGF